MPFIGLTFELGACVLTEYDPDGFLNAQPDGLGGDPRVAPYELHHPFGFASRPRDPETGPNGEIIEGQACNLLIGTDGNETHVWLAADPRFTGLLPPIKPGGSVQYAAGGPGPSFDMHDGEDGTKTIYVEIGDSAHVVTIGRDGNGDPLLSLIHSDGMAVILHNGKAIIKNSGGDCYIEIGDGGGVLNGNWRVTGDISDSSGVSLLTHLHPTGVGPSGPPTPGLV